MTIKQQGGIFGRNPTFNDVTVDGTLTTSGALSFDELNVDNININGNTISSTDTDGNVTVDPNGTGALVTSGADIVARDTGNNELKIKAKSGGGDARTAEIFSGASVPTTDVALGGLRFYNAQSGISDDIVCQIVAKRGTNNNNAYLDFSTSQGGRSDQMRLQHNGNLSMTGGGNITFNSGSGIDFSATSGTGTSELFDDYEEGTFTPTITSAGTAPTVTYSNQTGTYTKVGNRVHVDIYISTSAYTAGTGNFRIAGLPFTAASVAAEGGAAPMGFRVNTSAEARLKVEGGNTYCQMLTRGTRDTSTGWGNAQSSIWGTANPTILTVSFTYVAA